MQKFEYALQLSFFPLIDGPFFLSLDTTHFYGSQFSFHYISKRQPVSCDLKLDLMFCLDFEKIRSERWRKIQFYGQNWTRIEWLDRIHRSFLNSKVHVFWEGHKIVYRKVASSNTSRLKAHAGFFRLLIKGILDNSVTFWQKVDFLISNATRTI